MTKTLEVRNWLIQNPGTWTTKSLRFPLSWKGRIRASRSTIYTALKMLEHQGLATRQGNGRNTLWIVGEQNG